jgi:hypothetical protein
MELSTTSQADAGTNDTTAMTPKKHKQYSGNLPNLNNVDVNGHFSVGTFEDVVISAGSITVLSVQVDVDTEASAASDDLDTISGLNEGRIVILAQSNSNRDIVVTENGNIRLQGGSFTLSGQLHRLTLVKHGNNFHEISRNYGGGDIIVNSAFTATGVITGLNLSGTNTGDQDLSALAVIDEDVQFTNLDLNNGLTPTAATIYNTFTDASNYERAFFRWNSDVLTIGTEAAGTGTVRDIAFTGDVSTGDLTSSVIRGTVIGASFSIGVENGGVFIKTAGSNLKLVDWSTASILQNLDVKDLTASGTVTAGTFTVATLPTAAAGMTCFVSDGSVLHAGNSGTIVAGSGANFVPVYYDGTNWRIS